MNIKKSLAIIFLTLFLITSLHARDEDEIDKSIVKMGLTLKVPENFSEIPKVQQEVPGTYYDKGYKHNEIDLEIRFFLMPIEIFGENHVQFYNSFPQTILYNITHEMYYILKEDYIIHFPEEAVHADFGGDLGFTCHVTGESDFLKGYKYAMVTVVFKEEKGMFFIFLLFNDTETIEQNQEIFQSSFYILRFK